MSENFRVSVIIPAYNSAQFLDEAIASVYAQSHAPHEIIVVDDGSNDHTAEIATRHGSRIRFHRQENRGVSAARNAAIERATGNWLAFLDADDIWESDYLAKVQALCQGDTVLVFTDYRTFGAEERIFHPAQALAHWKPEEELLTPLISVLTCCSVVRGGLPVRFPEWARNDEDAIYFNEISEWGAVRSVAEPLMRYRRHPASAQARNASRSTGCENMLRWARERENLRPGSVRRLFRTLEKLVLIARWKRNWPQYWMFRRFCERNWPNELPRSPILTERIWPELIYRLKDQLDTLRRPMPRDKE